jgi:thiaminase/transcriptional activator TenA
VGAVSGDDRFTGQLRERARPAWREATEHRFTRELADGSLDRDVFRAYLLQDYAFVDALVSVVGYAVAQAPSMSAKGRLATFLGTVTDEENDYFERSFEALDVSRAAYADPTPDEVTLAFRDHLLASARGGGYAETLAVLLPAEWIYRAWAVDVVDPPEPFYFAEWVELHANPEFEAFVDWLRDQLDAEGEDLSARRRARVASLFERTAKLEVAFFDAAYEAV